MVGMIYLASPYTHADRKVMTHRYEVTKLYTQDKLRSGLCIFSPIVYGRAMEAAIGHKFEDWLKFNDAVLARCNFVWVLQLDGWEWSRGIAHELELAEELGILIRMVQP